MTQLIVTCVCGNEMPIPRKSLGASGRCSLCGTTFEATAANTRAAAPVATAAAPATKRKAPARLPSLDQLRGYAIFGMMTVNYLGNFEWMPGWFEHSKNHFSYADTIAPLFIFVVGMGFRLSIRRRMEREDPWAVRLAVAKRYLILTVVGMVFYGPDAKIDWWDALVQIGLSGLIAVPFIDKPTPVRLVAGLGYLGLFTGLYLGTDYATWIEHRSMNGGPISPLAYAFILLCGTIAYDLLDSGDTKKILLVSLGSAVALAAAAFVMYAVLPKDMAVYKQYGAYWPFAKRWSLPPFIFISTSCAFVAFALFYWICDVKEIEIPHLSILGMNPLVIYLVQYSILSINHTYLPEAYSKAGASPVPGLIGFVLVYLFIYATAWRLHKDGTVIKL